MNNPTRLLKQNNIRNNGVVYTIHYVNEEVKDDIGKFSISANMNVSTENFKVVPCQSIVLNNLTIRFGDMYNTAIEFYSDRYNAKFFITLSLICFTTDEDGNLYRELLVILNNQNTSLPYKMPLLAKNNWKFDKLSNCYNMGNLSRIPSKNLNFNIGILGSSYSVIYNNKVFDSSFKVFVHGLWGILLDSELSLYAVFIIDSISVHQRTLTIGHFIWCAYPENLQA